MLLLHHASQQTRPKILVQISSKRSLLHHHFYNRLHLEEPRGASVSRGHPPARHLQSDDDRTEEERHGDLPMWHWHHQQGPVRQPEPDGFGRYGAGGGEGRLRSIGSPAHRERFGAGCWSIHTQQVYRLFLPRAINQIFITMGIKVPRFGQISCSICKRKLSPAWLGAVCRTVPAMFSPYRCWCVGTNRAHPRGAPWLCHRPLPARGHPRWREEVLVQSGENQLHSHSRHRWLRGKELPRTNLYHSSGQLWSFQNLNK